VLSRPLAGLPVILVLAVSVASAQPAPAGPAAPAGSAPPAGPAAPAGSTPPAGSAPPVAQEAKLAEAKELFRRGNALRKAGSLESALELFLRSRGLVPSIANTQNAAVMLDELGRHDEALELYETLLVEFAGKLSEEDRRDISAAVGALQGRVGAVFVSANIDGAVIVDGHRRGVLPLGRPIRLLVGEHRVLVLREGYAPAEARVGVVQGKTAVVDLRLEPLAAAGRLAVTDEAGVAEVAVLVDGAPVSDAPWAGQLAPGRHLISLRGKEVGTAPREVTVVVGQTVTLALRSEPLGPPVRIEVEPSSAQLVLDGVALDAGPFQGRLPRRPLSLVATEEGYFREEIALDFSQNHALLVRLRVDDQHPRWRQAEPLRIRLEATLAGLVGSTLGSDAEASCPAGCPARSAPVGWMVGARGALLLPRGLEFSVGAGYLGIAAAVQRELPGNADHAYRAQDKLALSGPFATLGVGYGLGVNDWLRLVGSASLGVFRARARDDIRADVVRGAEFQPLKVEGANEAVHGVDLFALPELRAQVSRGTLHAGLSLGLGVFLLDGPALPIGEAYVSSTPLTGCAKNPSALACVAGTSRFAGERSYQFHLMQMAQLSAGVTF
jgi:hypothetical protein